MRLIGLTSYVGYIEMFVVGKALGQQKLYGENIYQFHSGSYFSLLNQIRFRHLRPFFTQALELGSLYDITRHQNVGLGM